MPGKAIRYPQNMCPTYNGDFDGDEHNFLQPTTVETAVEVRELAALDRQRGGVGNRPLRDGHRPHAELKAYVFRNESR